MPPHVAWNKNSRKKSNLCIAVSGINIYHIILIYIFNEERAYKLITKFVRRVKNKSLVSLFVKMLCLRKMIFGD